MQPTGQLSVTAYMLTPISPPPSTPGLSGETFQVPECMRFNFPELVLNLAIPAPVFHLAIGIFFFHF